MSPEESVQEPPYRHILDAHFQDRKFLFGTKYLSGNGKRISTLKDFMDFFKDNIGTNTLAVFQKPGLPEEYRSAVSDMIQ